MVSAAEKNFKDGNPLRGDAAVPLPQLGQGFVKTILPGLHDRLLQRGIAPH
jgi:hypothetical protein